MVKILISAYACEPNKGSEPGVGWNWSLELSKKYKVYVITRSNNKVVIDSFLQKNPNDNIKFFYYDLPTYMKKIKKIPNGIYLYYNSWQKKILPLAKQITSEYDIDIIHHITFNEFRTPGKLYKIDKPFVWGPIGGGQLYNPIFKQAFFRKSDILKEKFRNLLNLSYIRYSKDIKNAVDKSSCILIADQSTEKIMPKIRRYDRLLETAYNCTGNYVKKYNSQKEKIELIWVGGIWPRKGLKLLIDALGSSDFNKYNLTIIGDGNDIKLCENLVCKYRIEDRIKFVGKVDFNEINEYYKNADLFIFSSLRDTSGNVVLEAMAHCLPVIALNHHGVGEIVTKNTGSLIDVTNYDQIKKDLIFSIKKYSENFDLRKEHGENGQKRLKDIYSWEKNISVISNIYDKVLK